ncbi:MAG: YdeI family protein [Caldilineaceae bacterium]|nr:YdeI family protein [Caldilineaceae bacterium]HRJ40628.1 YdeI family protein [Caldilineaceae bacterium]
MSGMNPKVDFYFGKADQWKAEFEKLRTIILECDLTEELKWGHPCYALEGSNIVLMHGFKEYCALLFMKGALMQDPNGILVQQTENVQSARQIRFTALQEIVEMEAVLKAYVTEAVRVEKAGLQVEFKQPTDFEFPEEFIDKLEEVPGLQDAFEALTPGRQRGYLLHFSGAKQSKTRTARIEKWVPAILEGKGIND